MFDLENKFVNAVLNSEKEKVEKHNVVEKYLNNGLFEKIKIELTDIEIYYDSVGKWFFRLNDVFDSIQKIQIDINRNRFTRKGMTTTYNKLLKSLNDYNLYLASFHDLSLHLLVAVLRIKITHKNITWNKIKNYSPSEINLIMEELFTLLEGEIKFRNSSLHDFDYSWIEKYFSYETIRFLSIMSFPELKIVLEPLQKPLVHIANLELIEIKENVSDKIKTLEKTTYKLFNCFMKYYEKSEV